MALLCGLVVLREGQATSLVQTERSLAAASTQTKSITPLPIVLASYPSPSSSPFSPLRSTPLTVPHGSRGISESYIDGCHNLSAPNPGFSASSPGPLSPSPDSQPDFSSFPTPRVHTVPKVSTLFAAAGAAAIALAYRIDHSQLRFYAVYDYWHTSPNFLMMRVGLLLLISFLAYAWCRWEPRLADSTPLSNSAKPATRLLGPHRIRLRTPSILPKRANPSQRHPRPARNLPLHAPPLASPHENRLEEIPCGRI